MPPFYFWYSHYSIQVRDCQEVFEKFFKNFLRGRVRRHGEAEGGEARRGTKSKKAESGKAEIWRHGELGGMEIWRHGEARRGTEGDAEGGQRVRMGAEGHGEAKRKAPAKVEALENIYIVSALFRLYRRCS